MPRKLSRRTLRRREQQAIGGVHSLSEVNPTAVVERYVAGEKIQKMAAEYGVSDVAMYAFLLRHVPEEWMAAQKAKAFALKERGENGLENPSDALDLGASRELLRAGQWDLERVDRKNYGRDDVNINVNVLDLGERLRRSRDRVGQHPEYQIGNEPSLSLSRGREASIDAELVDPGATERCAGATEQRSNSLSCAVTPGEPANTGSLT